jgi:membrane fusion protein
MLFRSEVIEQRGRRSIGRTIPLYASDSLPIIAIILVLVTVLAGWLVSGSYARTEQVSGWVVPSGSTSRILSTSRGTLVSLEVAEGERVSKGQRLGAVEIQNANEASSDPAARSLFLLDEQRHRLDEQRRLARNASMQDAGRLEATVREIRVQISSIDRQIALQRKRVESARTSFAILTDAEAKNYISRIDFENQKRAFLDEQAQLQALISARAQLRTSLAEAKSQASNVSVALRSRLAELDSGEIEIEQRRMDIERNRAVILEAPIDGRVAALQARVGQTVEPEIPVMYVLGDNVRMEVELLAPSRAIGFAKPGQSVRLMYDAFPYQQFGTFSGTVYEISHTALRPGEVESPARVDEPVYRLRIRLDSQVVRGFGDIHRLQPGMTLRANLVLERQTFLDWLLEPISAVRNRT